MDMMQSLLKNKPSLTSIIKKQKSLSLIAGAIIKHGGGKAFYAPQPDFIQMPEKADFKGTKDSTPEQSLITARCYMSFVTGQVTRRGLIVN
jgi:antirestriction protein ArdC